MKLNNKLLYILLFAILYLGCAVVSCVHSISFFGLANGIAMAATLAIIFEVGQAAVLFSLLTSKKDRSKKMPWILMVIFTLVQILGNVFSSYKYLVLNSVAELPYFRDPIFIWTSLPDAQCNVILSYLLGGLLPITCLALTSMVTNFLEDGEIQKEITEPAIEKIEEDIQNENDADDFIEEKDSEPSSKVAPRFINL